MLQNDRTLANSGTIPLPVKLVNGYLPSLDGLRGIAIIMVMLCHFAGDYQQVSNPFYTLLRFGSAGVDLFFVLSGFLITGILFDSRSSDRYFRNFYVRRILRIVPLYYAALIMTLVLLPMFHVVTDAKVLGREVWLMCFVSNFVPGAPIAASMGYFGHFWSLAVEEHFYLLWPFVIRFCDRRMGIWACLGCMVGSILFRIGAVSCLDPVHARDIVNYWTPARMEALAFGGLIALLARGPNARTVLSRIVWWMGPVLAVLLGALCYANTTFFSLSSAMVILRSSLCAWVSGAVLILAVLCQSKSIAGQFFRFPLLRLFGKHSYALYVIHFLMMPLFELVCPIRELTAWTGSEFFARSVFLAVMMTGSWIAALISWHLLEKPFLAMKDVWAPRSGLVAPTEKQSIEPTLAFRCAG